MIFSVTTQQMSEAEAASEKKGISRARLMHNAARGCFDFIKRRFENYRCLSYAVICGSGNNGGDGIELSFLLRESGIRADVILTDKLPDTETARACINTHSIALKGAELKKNPQSARDILLSADIIIDCVFGTGFHGELPKDIGELFDFSGKCGGVKISVDIPSGVNGNSGTISPHSFKPDITLMLAAVKTGILNYPCRDFCGEVRIVDIGIASDCYKKYDGIIAEERIMKLLPKRPESANKGTFGKLLNVAGSRRYRGAALLSSKAALRAGAGLVTLASVEEAVSAAAAALPECVFLNMPADKDGFISSRNLTRLGEEAEKASAVTIGCGLGNNESTKEIVSFLLKKGNCPIILDADGINCLADNINILKDNNRPIIMTPHPGEFSRLLKATVSDVQSDRLNLARSFAAEYNVILLLKGRNTVIASPDGRVCINSVGNNALAKAGCGDVLTGIIGALAAQGTKPFLSAALGAYIHGRSADISVNGGTAPAALLAGEMADGLRYIM